MEEKSADITKAGKSKSLASFFILNQNLFIDIIEEYHYTYINGILIKER